MRYNRVTDKLSQFKTLSYFYTGRGPLNMKSIHIGLLFSLTGTTSVAERGQYQAALYALEEYRVKKKLNDPIFFSDIRDIRSDPIESYKQALSLAKAGVKIFIGCYTSACRKAVLPVLEQFGCLLVYPTSYEGQEIHPHVIYIGEVPNQQITSLLQFMIPHVGKKVYLIGSDYIYPRYTNEQIREFLLDFNGVIVDEQYVPLGHNYFIPMIKNIENYEPDVIISTLVGESILHFYRQYYDLGLNPQKTPIISPVTTELEIKEMGPIYAAGHYSCVSYFQSLDNPENNRFVLGMKTMYGKDFVVSSFVCSAYTGVSIMLEVLLHLGTTNFKQILKFLYGRSFLTPSGTIQVNRNHHLTRKVRIGQANLEGQFDIVWSSDQPIIANPLLNNMIYLEEGEGEPWKAIVELWGQVSSEAIVVLDGDNQVLYSSPEAFSLVRAKSGEFLPEDYLKELASYHDLQTHNLGPYRFIRISRTEKGIATNADQDMEEFQFDRICTRSPSFKNELLVAQIASQSDASTLILGDTGSGKEVIARAIHNQSPRKKGPFIAVNAGAIPRELIASELFGYVEGAFTGSRKGGGIGKFEAADGGTLFLDEIGDMPLELQVSLLRVLEEHKVVRVGDHKERPINVRIIAATNRHLKEEIAFQGSFRSDLFYRLNVFTITIPTLQQRSEDMEILALQFLNNFCEHYKKGPSSLSIYALQALKKHSWPGNVRELRNVMERAFLLAKDEKVVDYYHLPPELQDKTEPVFVRSSNNLKKLEKETIEKALQEASSISEAARNLGITRSTLYRKMNNWKIKI
jgi:DNA-binding NtrC family response regulator/ABC-type branched-subunit amino acid transport system substrate-binding protein